MSEIERAAERIRGANPRLSHEQALSKAATLYPDAARRYNDTMREQIRG